jgi:Ca-activated chloride channel homolog
LVLLLQLIRKSFLLQFQHKEYLWLLAGLPALLMLFYFHWQWKQNARRKIGDEKLVKAITGNYSAKKFTLKFLLLLVAFAAGVLAVMNLRKEGA